MPTSAGTYADLDRLVSLMTGDEKHAAAAETVSVQRFGDRVGSST